MRLCHYSVQGNHLHLVAEARDAASLGRAMKGLGVRIARGLNGLMGTRGPVLADRYHARILRTPREVRASSPTCSETIVTTPRSGRPARPTSRRRPGTAPARGGSRSLLVRASFDGWRLPLSGAPAEGRAGPLQAPVARPHTWLLSIGWRRHGLLVPG